MLATIEVLPAIIIVAVAFILGYFVSDKTRRSQP